MVKKVHFINLFSTITLASITVAHTNVLSPIAKNEITASELSLSFLEDHDLFNQLLLQAEKISQCKKYILKADPKKSTDKQALITLIEMGLNILKSVKSQSNKLNVLTPAQDQLITLVNQAQEVLQGLKEVPLCTPSFTHLATQYEKAIHAIAHLIETSEQSSPLPQLLEKEVKSNGARYHNQVSLRGGEKGAKNSLYRAPAEHLERTIKERNNEHWEKEEEKSSQISVSKSFKHNTSDEVISYTDKLSH